MSWGDFLDVTSKAQSIKEKVDKLDFIQIKNVCSMKDTGKRKRRPATNWKKMFANHVSSKELIFRIYKQVSKHNNVKRNDPMKQKANNLNRCSTKKGMQMETKHMKRCTSLVP